MTKATRMYPTTFMKHDEQLRTLVRELLAEKKELAKTTSDWQPWPLSVQDVPYEGSAKNGIGPGEQRLAKMWKGKIFGSGVSMDVLAGDGTKWEVKAPGARTSAGSLRIEQEGIKLMEPHFDAIKNVVRTLLKVFGDNFDFIKAVNTTFSPEQIDFVRSFLFKPGSGRGGKDTLPPAQDMLRGEISESRAQAFLAVLKVVSLGMYTDYSKKRDVKQKYLDKYAQIRNVTQRYSEKTKPKKPARGSYEAHVVIGVAKLLDISPEVIMSTIGDFGLTPTNVIDTQLQAMLPPEQLTAFIDPVAFMDEHWTNMLVPSELFSSLDGVVLVDQEGYRVIALADVDRCLGFMRVSKGTPYLRVKA